MKKSVNDLFERYKNFFCMGIEDKVDMEQVASSYAPAFISASPAGVMIGQNNEQFKDVMRHGFEYYRQIGTKAMNIRNIRITTLDEYHCVAHVAWAATYTRKDTSDVTINFEVHYFIQKLEDEPKIFGWVSGDEQAALKQQGII